MSDTGVEVHDERITIRALQRNAAEVVDRARSLDAIHVAAALRLGPALAHFVSYDKRLIGVAREQALSVATPS